MSEPPRAILLSVGTELTEGILQDGHVRFLASELTALGFQVLQGMQLPDRRDLIVREIRRAAAQSDLLVMTGGLGPTSDDLAREAAAEAAGVPLEFHPEAWEAIVARFRGRPVADANRRQAMAPRGFPLIPNANGTAPGFQGDLGGCLLVSLPGPPGELRPMFSDAVMPLLAGRFRLSAAGSVTWGTALMVSESALEDAFRGERAPSVAWGTRVEDDRIAFSLRGGTDGEREGMLRRLADRLGDLRIRGGNVRPVQLLSDLLLERGWMAVTAESCTGGLLAKCLTDLPGSSRIFWGGFVAYDNAAKESLLRVPRAVLDTAGAVSEQTVRAMAEEACRASSADLGIAVSGVAGPEGGTPEKPVGTVWIAAALRGGPVKTLRILHPATRDMVRRRAAVAAFLLAEQTVLGREFPDGLQG